MHWLLGGTFLGWALGSNDAANVFGTAVSSKMVKFKNAVILASIFIIIGALLKGSKGIETLSSLSDQTILSATITSISAAITVTIMTIFKMPISTSQAVVGAIIGQSFIAGNLNLGGLKKVILCWIGTPIGAFFLSLIIYRIVKIILKKHPISFIYTDGIIKALFIFFGCYGSFALGANNVANVVGIYNNLIPAFTPFNLALIGSLSIAIGVITNSKRVMMTVGKSLVEMNTIKSLVALVASSLTVYVYALVGVPVSASQAVIGAVLGMGSLKFFFGLNWKMLVSIMFAWVLTPCCGMILSYTLCKIFLK